MKQVARRGRPPKHGEKLSKNRTFRLRGSLDRDLQAAAAAAGRPVSEEIEYRLEQSFTFDRFFDATHGDATAEALRLIAKAMRNESARDDGTNWRDDPSKAEAVRTAAHLIIAAFAGLPADPAPLKYDDATTELRPAERGRVLARLLLESTGRKLPEQKDSTQ